MLKGVLYFLFWVSFLSAIVFWREATAKFLRRNGEVSEFRYKDFLLLIVWDFLRAIAVRGSNKTKLPIGVYLHGLFLTMSIALLVYASMIADC